MNRISDTFFINGTGAVSSREPIRSRGKGGNSSLFIEALLIMCVIYSLIMQLPEMRGLQFAKAVLYLNWMLLIAFCAMYSRIVFSRTVMQVLCILLVYDTYCVLMDVFRSSGYLENKLFPCVNISVGMFLAGYLLSFHLGTSRLLRISVIYALTVCALLPYIFYRHVISTDTYESKNSFGPIIVFAVIALISTGAGRNLFLKMGKWALILFSVYAIAAMNNRASLVSLTVLALYYALVVVDSRKKKLCFIGTFLLVVISGILSGSIPDIVSAVTKIEKFGGDLDALSSGRIGLIVSNWSGLAAHPLLGVGRGYVENFHFSALLQLGIIGSIPVFLLYALPLVLFPFRRGVAKYGPLRKMVALMALHGMVISVFEELAPFGQGTSYFILWLMTGYALGVGNHDAYSPEPARSPAFPAGHLLPPLLVPQPLAVSGENSARVRCGRNQPFDCVRSRWDDFPRFRRGRRLRTPEGSPKIMDFRFLGTESREPHGGNGNGHVPGVE